MELEDGFDDLLAQIDEPTISKRPKTGQDELPGNSNDFNTILCCFFYFVSHSNRHAILFAASTCSKYISYYATKDVFLFYSRTFKAKFI